MKLPLTRQLALLATATLVSLTFSFPGQAITFDEQPVEQTQAIAIARPYGGNKYDLLILQQIPGQRQCWQEIGSNPVVVDPLLLNFDFTGSCERSTDSNGYSLRIDGQDYGLDYLLRIVERKGELVLVGTSRTNYSQPEVVIGRTHGISQGFLKIDLDPGWSFSRRAYQGRVLSHVYLSGDRSAMQSPDTTATTATTSDAAQNRPPQTSASTSDSSTSVREFTFTAEDNPAPPTSALSPSTPRSFQSLPSLPLPRSPQASPSSPSLPTPPSLSNLPPLPAPPQVTDSPVVPPPLTNSSGNSSRRSLSDVLVVAPRSPSNPNRTETTDPNRLPVPNSPLPDMSESSSPKSDAVQGYRVMVAASDSSQQRQVRSLYPDAFPTFYQGRSLWQVGIFSSRDNAETALQSLQSLGLEGIIIQ